MRTRDTQLKHRQWGPIALAAGLLVPVLATTAPAAQIRSEPPARELRDRSLDFEASGLQVGDSLPDFQLTTLGGDAVPLSTLWRDKPTVLVTCSLTCPVSRSRMRQVDRMRIHFGDAIHILLLYTLEAHPEDSGSPYSIDRVRWLTQENIKQGVFFPQPDDMDERTRMARKFVERMDTPTPLFLDGIDNTIWRALGGGPNMGFLIGTDGNVEVKHGWFDGGTMYKSVEAYLDGATPGWRAGRPDSRGARQGRRSARGSKSTRGD